VSLLAASSNFKILTYFLSSGDHTIEVKFHDKPVNGSPFTSKVHDASQVIVNNVPGSSVVGKPVEFQSK